MSITDMAEGMTVFAIREVKGFGYLKAFGSVSLGSEGVVERLLPGGFALVEFTDCETGEKIKGDLTSSEVEKVGAQRAWPRQYRTLPSYEYATGVQA